MTVQVVVQPTVAGGEDGRVGHVFCHDPARGLCGAVITGPGPDLCVVCAALNELNQSCGDPGCDR
jgi:hypothetical protein